MTASLGWTGTVLSCKEKLMWSQSYRLICWLLKARACF